MHRARALASAKTRFATGTIPGLSAARTISDRDGLWPECCYAVNGGDVPMRPSFDEMRAGGDTVREHYRGYDRWLARTSADCAP